MDIDIPTIGTKVLREAFAKAHLPTRVQLQLNQPFGKDTINQSFASDVCFRHTFVHVFPFLGPFDLIAIQKASYRAFQFVQIQEEYGTIDFQKLQGFDKDWESRKEISDERKALTTACFLHYKFDTPSVVRWIGGPHVAAHRDVNLILKKLANSVAPTVLKDLERILRFGPPALCNATSTDKNLKAFREYGNHKSIDQDREKTNKALVKDNAQGYSLHMDPRLVNFIPHLHLTPQGIINLDNPDKKARPIFDSSHRPQIWAHSINDWTDKMNEPPLEFATSFDHLLQWIWNLQISYPREEIYLGDDDAGGAFRHIKYHPNLVAMHSSLVQNLLFMATAQTFGDNTSPSNWEPVALSRQQHAQFLWHLPDIIERAKPYLPEIELTPPPTPDESKRIVQASPDNLNKGVFDSAGNRLPPQYDHHVDDNIYADVACNVHRTVSASAIALFDILGYPNELLPSCLSIDKLNTSYSWMRRILGFVIDSRKMSFTIPQERRDKLVELLTEWTTKTKFDLKEAAHLHGLLENASRACRWARPYFLCVQNAIRTILTHRYHQAKGYITRQGLSGKLQAELPKALQSRIEPIISKKIAAVIWNSRAKVKTNPEIRQTLGLLRDYLKDPGNPWEMLIGHAVDRDPNFVSFGDASDDAGGAFCESLQFWFDIQWNEKIRKGRKLKSRNPNYIHINCLEFAVVIIQIAAVITRLENLPREVLATFPNGIPEIPVLLTWTDNTSTRHWTQKVTSTSPRGQSLVAILAELYKEKAGNLSTECEWIKGIENVIADDIHLGLKDQVLELFPAESRVSITSGIGTVLRCMSGSTKSPKELGTIRSRRLHYFHFVCSMKLTDDILLEFATIKRCNWQLALYATHLATGSNLVCRSIKAVTISAYIHDVARFLSRFSNRDPRKEDPTRKDIAPCILAVTKEVQRWEKMPNRREPFTIEMLDSIITRCEELQPDSFLPSFKDWAICGLYGGFRLSEWAEPEGHAALDRPLLDDFNDPKAFCLGDLELQDSNKKYLSLATALAGEDSEVHRATLTFRTQKNGDNGQTRIWLRNTHSDKYCFIAAILRILRRFISLVGWDYETPLCIFNEGNTPRLITSNYIETALRDAAALVYNIDPTTQAGKARLSKWSSHSFRVGACVILHALGFNAEQIKQLLRWRSMSFMKYLRNLGFLAMKQNKAISDVGQMPNFI